MTVTDTRSPAQPNNISPAEALTGLGLFLLALLPRAYDLSRFVTADEAKWVYRSARFLAALLQGDFAATSVNLTPAVSTTWLGSIGLAGYYWLNRAAIDLPLTGWLLSLPQFRADLPLLVAVRWPMVLLTALGVVLFYHLARRLFRPAPALLAALLIALDPHTISLSRILGHDAPTALFNGLALLLLLLAVAPRSGRSGSPWLLALSGVAAGLAFLSKAPALFLIPFTGLVLGYQVWQQPHRAVFWAGRWALWGGAAYLTFVLLWPAAWVNPLGQPVQVFQNAFLSATDFEEADDESYWRVPNLGPAYYLVNGGFKLSPLVFMGVALTLLLGWAEWRHTPALSRRLVTEPTGWLLAFVLLFTVFMTLATKRSPRYILPIFDPLAMVAALGWLQLFDVAAFRAGLAERAQRWTRYLFQAGLGLSALLIVLPYMPYYFSYYNPLLGGSFTAPRLMKIGWGEGLDRVGRFLQREHRTSRVGTAYASTVAPFFEGDISGVTGDHLDFVVLYQKQVQSGAPAPYFIRYFESIGPTFFVDLNGLHYANVYTGPALQPAAPVAAAAGSPQPVGFRPLSPYGRIGQPLEIDVVWQIGRESQPGLAEVALISGEGDRLAQGAGGLSSLDDDLAVSRHHLSLPDDLARGVYHLSIDGRPLGEIELRRFALPPDMSPIEPALFEEQISLRSYQFEPTEDYIRVTLAWQAQKPYLPDYTVFVQLLDIGTNQRLAGFDSQPLRGAWPTSRWAKGEVVVDEHIVAIPPDLPDGFYKLIVGLYRPESGQRLQLANGRDHWLLPWTFIWGEE